MMLVVRVRATVLLDGKTSAVTPGYRPTLSFAGKKALCNFETIEPAPLSPNQTGEASIALGWDWPWPSPIREGTTFTALEGEHEVGSGTITKIECVEARD